MTEHSPNSDGFTLIEVLVALVILALAAGFAFKTISGSFAWLSQADQEQRAVTVVETELARLGHEIAVKPGEQTGLDGDVSWRMEIGPALTDPAPVDALAAYPVRVLTEWRDGDHIRQWRIRTVRMGLETHGL